MTMYDGFEFARRCLNDFRKMSDKMAFILEDGSRATDYEVGDGFIVVNDGPGYSQGDALSLCGGLGNEKPIFHNLCDGVYMHAAWPDLTPDWIAVRATKERREKYRFVNNGFTKSDLKDGMLVYLRNGRKCCMVKGILVDRGKEHLWAVADVSDYSPEMTTRLSGFEIDKVTDSNGAVLFERKPEKRKVTLELTEEQEAKIKKDLGL